MLQTPLFTEVEFGELAQELDKIEKELMMEQGMESPEFLQFLGQDSQNVDQQGNFSVQVIKKAFGVMDLTMTPIDHPSNQHIARNPLLCEAFICNLNQHWFGIRRLFGHYFNFNSLLKHGPILISDFYLAAYLNQLQNDRYSIFLIEGKFPMIQYGLSSDMAGLGGGGESYRQDRGHWYPIAPIIANKVCFVCSCLFVCLL